MEINEMSAEQCSAFLARASVGRLACSLQNQPYVVPINFAYESGYLYVFSTYGQKIKWMRSNPRVCVQSDEIQGPGQWLSVVVYGEYQELPEPQYTAERQHAASLLGQRYHWWLNALGQRQISEGDNPIEPLFFRIRVHTMSGLRATEENKSAVP